MTSFRITGLSPLGFQNLFGLRDDQLEKRGVKRYIVDERPGFPDRIELRDAELGESVLLVNYLHQPADTPYRASHAIFVREGAAKTFDRVNEVPEALRGRLLSLRAFDRANMMVDADTVDGTEVEKLIGRFLANNDVAYVQAHFAKRGCYAARIERP